MFRHELAIHHDRGNVNLELPAERHTLTCVACHVDEDSLDTLHIDIDGERRQGLRQYELNVLAGHAPEYGLEVA